MDSLSHISLISEQMRKEFSEKLRETLASNESLKNQTYNERMRQEISTHTICYLQEQFKKLQLGTLDGTMIAQNNSGPFYPKIDLLVLPYMIQNYDHAVKVADGPIGQMIWGAMPKEVGVHLVTIPLFSFRHIYNTKMPINNLTDFANESDFYIVSVPSGI